MSDPSADSTGPREPTDVERSENVKHLELIQAIVTRLATNSFLIKGWTLTVAAAAFGFAVNRIDWKLAIAGSLVVVGFWIMDSYYLRQERLFRHLYNHVRRNISIEQNERFSMNLVPFATFSTVGRINVLLSLTLVVFYPLLAAVGIAVAVVSTLTTATPAPPPMR